MTVGDVFDAVKAGAEVDDHVMKTLAKLMDEFSTRLIQICHTAAHEQSSGLDVSEKVINATAKMLTATVTFVPPSETIH